MANEQERAKILAESMQRTFESFKKMEGSFNSISDGQQQLAARQEEYSDRQRLINEMMDNFSLLTDEGVQALDKLVQQQEKEYYEIRRVNKELAEHNKRIAQGEKLYQNIANQAKKLWSFLNENDKVIRQTILNLGLSGTKAEMMRTSFENSALYAAKLGGGLQDVQAIMTGFADETGRAVVLSEDMVKNVLAIGRGTGLGVEQATRLAAQFEFMGVDAQNAMELVQGVVDTSERMGVNTTKVLKTVTDNFKKLSTFTFQGGVKAFGQMAMDAERTRVSMASALDVAEATRGLEQVIELGANLQVMGGEFAKMDPFQWLYIARNEPDKMIDKISEMTKGIYTFKKNSEGTFEKVISPADRDRLAQVAKSLGKTNEEMFEIAQRRLDLDTMDKQLAAAGLTENQKKLIEGAAKFDSSSGKFQVMLGGTMRDISTLTRDQAESFAKEQSSLEERAKQALTFDEAFKATMNELKSVLLPMLRGVKSVLEAVRPIAEGFTKFVNWAAKTPFGEGILKGGGLIMAGGFLLIKAFSLFGGLVGGLRNIIPAIGAKFGGAAASGMATGGGMNAAQTLAGGKASKAAGIGAGAKALGSGAGIGAAMAGAGTGIMLAAKGLAQLAEAMKGMTPEQAKALQNIAITMAVTFPVAAVGIALAGAAASSGALGFLALGAAFVGIGFGIKLATEGVSKMSLSLAKLNESGGGAGKQLAGVAGGVGLITLAMANGGAIALFSMNNSLARMERNAGGVERIGLALANMKLSLSGGVDDFVAVANALASIGKINIRGGGALADLASILKQPLKVEFADKNVAMVSNITLTIDGERFTEKTLKYDALVEHSERARGGLRGR